VQRRAEEREAEPVLPIPRGRTPPAPVHRQQERRGDERQETPAEKGTLAAALTALGMSIVVARALVAHVGERQSAQQEPDDQRRFGPSEHDPAHSDEIRGRVDTVERHRQARQRQHGGEKRHQDEPVQEEVAKVGRDERPGIGRQNAELGAQVVTVLPEPVDRPRLRGEGRLQWGAELLDDARRAPLVPMTPRGEPASDEPPSRHGRQVVDLAQQTRARQALENAQGERGTADAPSGQAQRG